MSNDSKVLLEAINLTKVFTIGGRVFGSRLTAVEEVNFSLSAEKSEIFTLAGESGSGKTTLARMILGLERPTSGSIQYSGINVGSMRGRRERMHFMKNVQPVFQNPFESFNPLKKVSTYLMETALNYGVARRRRDADKVSEDALNAVGLTLAEVAGRYPNEFSGGQLQRISVARSLITRSQLLVADEPVAMVDASIRISIINLFKKLKHEQRMSVIYITHDLATAYYISDRIAVMFRGNIIELGSVEKVIQKPLHPYTRMLIDSIPRKDPERKWQGTVKLSSLEIREFSKIGCRFSDRCPLAMKHCHSVEPPEIVVDDRVVRCHLYGENRP